MVGFFANGELNRDRIYAYTGVADPVPLKPRPGAAENGPVLPAPAPLLSPHISPTFVARASRCRCDKAHGPKDAEGVVDTTVRRP